MIGHLLNRTVEIWRRAETDDGAGGRETTWVRIDPARRVRISQPSTQERVVGQQAHGDLTHHVYARHGADLLRGDEIRDPSAGLTLRVKAVLAPSGPAYTRADCEELQSERS